MTVLYPVYLQYICLTSVDGEVDERERVSHGQAGRFAVIEDAAGQNLLKYSKQVYEAFKNKTGNNDIKVQIEFKAMGSGSSQKIFIKQAREI